MTTRETRLEAALIANAALRLQAERLFAAHVAAESDRHHQATHSPPPVSTDQALTRHGKSND